LAKNSAKQLGVEAEFQLDGLFVPLTMASVGPLPKFKGCKKEIGRSAICLRFNHTAKPDHKHAVVDQFHCARKCLCQATGKALQKLVEKRWKDSSISKVVADLESNSAT
jgi:hypothetical protein